MVSFDIQLTCINSVKLLVDAADHISCQVTVTHGTQMTDANSILGILALNLSVPVTVNVYGTQEQADTLRKAVSAYLA